MGKRGLCLVITGASASGKSTLARKLLENGRRVVRMTTTTSRPPRNGEKDGVDYYFVTPQEFERRIEKGEFLEYAHTYGNYYGSSRVVLEDLRSKHDVVFAVIDVQGLRAYKQRVEGVRSVYLKSPIAQLRRRLERRRLSEQEIARRLAAVPAEDLAGREADVVLVSLDGEMDTNIVPTVMQLASSWQSAK